MQENIKSEIIDKNKRELNRLKAQAAIAYPEAAQRIFQQKDNEEIEIPEIEEFDEENPGFSDEGISVMLSALEQMGFHLEDIEE